MQIKLGKILTVSGRVITDLPTIPAYVKNGHPFLCWAHVLGRCHFGNGYTFRDGHPKRQEFLDRFATEVVDTVGKGIAAIVAERQRDGAGSSPPKKAKGDEQSA